MRLGMLAACTAVVTILAGSALAQQPTSPPATTEPSPPPAAAPAPSAPGASMPEAAPPEEDTPRRRRRQRAAPAPADGAPAAARGGNKRRECRNEARQRGLRGREASDHAVICLAEARLECTKQAVAQKLGRRERAAFLRNCLGTPERKGGKRKRAR